MNSLNRKVFKDCAKAVSPALAFNILDVVLTSVLTVFTATVIASFTDAVFRLDFSYGVANFWKLLICLSVSLFVLPLFGTLKEILLFSKSLTHNRMIYGRFLNKKLLDAQRFSEGEIQYRLEEDAIDFRCSWLDIVTKYVSIPVTLAYLLYNSIKISALYTGIMFAVCAIKFFVPVLTRKINAKYDKQMREYNTEVRSQEIEIMGQPHKVKMFGLTVPLIEKLDRTYRMYFRNVYKKSIVFSSITGNISTTLDTFCTALILLSGSLLIVNGVITAGSMVAVFSFYSVLNSAFSDVSSLIRDTPILKTLADRLSVFYEGEEEEQKESITFKSSIEVRNLSFSYEEKKVFEGVNFRIKKGEKIAVCGQNGCGKSTLIKTLCGLLKDYSGHIVIDGKELSDVSSVSWYDNFAFVEQDPYLFSVSVRDNIRLGNIGTSEEKLDRIIDELGIRYLTDRDISNANKELSGGEKQKISIARALLKETPLLFMDEPSNNLDEDTVTWLKDFIIKSPKTIVFISHDPEIMKCSDMLVSLSNKG